MRKTDPSLYTKLRLYPGQKVYYPAPHEGIVIPAIVDETNEYITLADGQSAICSRYLDSSQNYVGIRTGKKNENGWDVYIEHKGAEVVEKLVKDAKMHSQFIWIDEPIGHELTIGDDVFLKLSDALAWVPPSRKKHLKRRLRRVRRRYMGFVSSTWKINGEDGPDWPKYPNKKVYIHR